MLFLDPPSHGRVRGLASKAFTPRRVEVLRGHIQDINRQLLDDVQGKGRMDVIAEEVIANTIVTMVGGQETTTNLIGNGVLSLLRNPDQLERLQNDLSLIPSAVEELLRYESASQQTARLAPDDV